MAIISKEEAEFIANSLEQYIELLDELVIVDGPADIEKYNNSMKACKKTIKQIRKRKNLEEIFDTEALEGYLPILRNQMSQASNMGVVR